MFTVGLEGVSEVSQNIDARVAHMSGPKAKKVWMRGALVFIRYIQNLIHSRSGTLSDAVFAAYGKPEKPNVLVGVSYGTSGKAPYAWLVEFGHGGPHPAPPYPYFKPGVLAGQPAAAENLIEGMHALAVEPLPLKRTV
jgi:hypothetical protein